MFVFSRCWRIREKHNCQADEVSTFFSCTERAKWTPFSLLFFLLPLASLMRCTTDTTLDYTLEEYSFSSAKQCQTPIIVSMGGNTPCKLQYKQVSCIMVMETTQQHTSVRACERMSCIWNTFLINVYGCIINHQPSTSQKHNIFVQFFCFFVCFFYSTCPTVILLYLLLTSKRSSFSPQTDLNSDLRKVFTLCLV